MRNCVCGGTPTKVMYDGISNYIRCTNCSLKVDDYDQGDHVCGIVTIEQKWELVMTGQYRREDHALQ